MESTDGDKKAVDAVGSSEWSPMTDTESTMTALEQLSLNEIPVVSPILESYLAHIARTGETVFSWDLLCPLIKLKMDSVIEEFVQVSPIEEVPPYQNVDPFKFESLKKFLSSRLQSYQRGPPFTIQRICELLTEPTKNHKRIDKFLRALEKNFLVISSPDCFGKPTPPEALANGVADADGAGDNLSDKSSSGVSSSSEKLAEDSNSDDEEKKKEEHEPEPETVSEMEVDVVCPPTGEASSTSSKLKMNEQHEDEPDRKKRKLDVGEQTVNASKGVSSEASPRCESAGAMNRAALGEEVESSPVGSSSPSEVASSAEETELDQTNPDFGPETEKNVEASSGENAESEHAATCAEVTTTGALDVDVQSVEKEVTEASEELKSAEGSETPEANVVEDLRDSSDSREANDAEEATINGCSDAGHPVVNASENLPVNGVDAHHDAREQPELVNGTAEGHEVDSPVLEGIPSKPPSAAPVPAVSTT